MSVYLLKVYFPGRSQEESFIVLVVDLCEEAASDEAQREGCTIEDEGQRCLDAGVLHILFAVITRVVLVAEALATLADARSIAAFLASAVVLKLRRL